MLGFALAGISMAGSYFAQQEEEEKQKRLLALKKKAAIQKNSAIQDAIGLNKMLNAEMTENAVDEIARATSDNVRDTQGKIQNTRSKLISTSEGLASGVSKGKQMLAYNVQSAKAVLEQKSQETSMLTQTLDGYYSKQAQLNQTSLQSQQEMKAALTQEYQGPSGISKLFNIANAGLQGYQTGLSLSNSIAQAQPTGQAASYAGYGSNQSTISGPRRPDGYL